MPLSFHSTHSGEKFVKKVKKRKCIKSVTGNNIQSFQYKIMTCIVCYLHLFTRGN